MLASRQSKMPAKDVVRGQHDCLVDRPCGDARSREEHWWRCTTEHRRHALEHDAHDADRIKRGFAGSSGGDEAENHTADDEHGETEYDRDVEQCIEQSDSCDRTDDGQNFEHPAGHHRVELVFIVSLLLVGE